MRFVALRGGVVLLGLAASIPVLAQDWPQFRGPGGLGQSDKPLPVTWGPNQNIAWKAALPGAGASTPVIVGDKLFLTAYSGYNVPGQPAGTQEALKRHVLCYSARDGKLLWNQEVPSRLPEQANIREGHGYASNSAVADSERVYVFFGKSGVFAFDHQGKQQWQADVGSNLNGWGSAASPVLHNDLVIVNASVESESLVALDKKSGKERWRARGIKEAWNTPLLVAAGSKTEVIVPIIGKVLSFDAATGQPLWTCDTGISWYMVPSVVAADGVIYCIGGRTGGGLAIRAGGTGDVTRSHRVWTGTKGSNVASPVFHQGHLYWMHENLGIAYCAEAKSGKIVYEERVANAGQIYSAALLADGKIYYLARNGRTFVVAARPQYELLASNDLGERAAFNSSPAASGGRLYIRSDKTLYCIGK